MQVYTCTHIHVLNSVAKCVLYFYRCKSRLRGFWNWACHPGVPLSPTLTCILHIPTPLLLSGTTGQTRANTSLSSLTKETVRLKCTVVSLVHCTEDRIHISMMLLCRVLLSPTSEDRLLAHFEEESRVFDNVLALMLPCT